MMQTAIDWGERRVEPGALVSLVKARGWSARIRLTSYPGGKDCKLEYALIRAPKGIADDVLIRALDDAEWRTDWVSLPPSMGGKMRFDRWSIPKLVARVLTDPLSNHELLWLTMKNLATDPPPVTFETEVRQVRAAETPDALERSFTALLTALAEHGCPYPEDYARLCFGLCQETELRKRQDWQADMDSRT